MGSKSPQQLFLEIVLHPNLGAVVGVIDWEITAFLSDGEMHSSGAPSTSRMGGNLR